MRYISWDGRDVEAADLTAAAIALRIPANCAVCLPMTTAELNFLFDKRELDTSAPPPPSPPPAPKVTPPPPATADFTVRLARADELLASARDVHLPAIRALARALASKQRVPRRTCCRMAQHKS